MRDWRPAAGAQTAFLECSAFEALFGGAAGGGKSDCLVASAARHIDQPTYRALLMRRTVPELEGSSGLIERTHAMYGDLPGATYHMVHRRWSFAGGARITLASCDHEKDRYKFKGHELQFIGFDELTAFPRSVYEYLMSRIRSASGVPVRVQGGTNPDGEGYDWVLDRWRWWLYRDGSREDEFDGPYLGPGQIAWVKRDLETGKDRLVRPGTKGAATRTFVPAMVGDNPFLAGTDYVDRLRMLDPLTRRRLELGDWMAESHAGAFFQRAWATMLDAAPARPVGRLRYWDRAATEASGSNDPDWTAGVLMSVDHAGATTVEHVARLRGEPAAVEGFIRDTCADDLARYGKIPEVLEQDPGSAGKFEIATYQRQLPDYDIQSAAPTGDKLTRFKPFSGACYRGHTGESPPVLVVRGAWNQAYFAELEKLPKGKWDQADASSGAYWRLTSGTGASSSTAGKSPFRGSMGGF